MPNSPPATPAMTLSFTTSGATVIAYPALAFATLVFQMGRPVFASSATRCASRVEKQCVTQDRQAAIDGSAARSCVRRGIVAVDPKDAAGFCIESERIARRLSDVHDAVHHERGGFKFLQRLRLKYPLLLEVLHV